MSKDTKGKLKYVEDPCVWLMIESSKNRVFRGILYTFISFLVVIACYGVVLNTATSNDVAALQKSTGMIEKVLYNSMFSSYSLADLETKTEDGTDG
jgi:hypothetical protein